MNTLIKNILITSIFLVINSVNALTLKAEIENKYMSIEPNTSLEIKVKYINTVKIFPVSGHNFLYATSTTGNGIVKADTNKITLYVQQPTSCFPFNRSGNFILNNPTEDAIKFSYRTSKEDDQLDPLTKANKYTAYFTRSINYFVVRSAQAIAYAGKQVARFVSYCTNSSTESNDKEMQVIEV